MRKLYSGIPIHIFALALTCGGLFFAPAHLHAEEATDVQVAATQNTTISTENTITTSTDGTSNSDEIISEDKNTPDSDIQDDNSQGSTSSDNNNSDNNSSEESGQGSSTGGTTTETPVTPPTEEQKPAAPSTPAKPATPTNSGSSSSSASQAPASNTTSGNSGKSSKKSENTNLNRWLKICENMGKNLKKKKFKYSNSGTRSTYKGALSSGKKSNCALYVSWCLQQYGALKKGRTFYVRSSGSLKKNFGKWGKKVKVIRVNKTCTSADLQKGDVVCWAGIAHCNIYAGRNNSGDRLWYDAGKSATYSGRSGSRFENVGAKTQGYLDSKRISYIIRIKNL
mgnify:CR=1 FL=1